MENLLSTLKAEAILNLESTLTEVRERYEIRGIIKAHKFISDHYLIERQQPVIGNEESHEGFDEGFQEAMSRFYEFTKSQYK